MLDAVHVWRARFSEHAADARAWTVLDDAERVRALGFRRDGDRDRFVIGRALLRRTLTTYTGVAAERLRFATGRFGKPSLWNAPGAKPLHFNLTHSGDLLLLAVAAIDVGIDCERWDDGLPYDAVAKLVFSAGERAALAALPENRKQRAFFTAWCRKEAFVKATGAGFSGELQAFDVSLEPGDAQPLLDVRGAVRTRWTMRDLPVEFGYSASLVAASRNAWVADLRIAASVLGEHR